MPLYKITGEVIEGKKLGRKLGFPTANLAVPEGGDAVQDGVYAARVAAAGRSYDGMANLGYNPSVAGGAPDHVLEVTLFGFEGDLYGETITVELLEFIRPEKKFGDLEALKRAVEEDRRIITDYFNKAQCI